MKEHDLLGAHERLIQSASCKGHVNVLDWFLDNGYKVVAENVIPYGIHGNHHAVLNWARQHQGIGWDKDTCLYTSVLTTCIRSCGYVRTVVLGVVESFSLHEHVAIITLNSGQPIMAVLSNGTTMMHDVDGGKQTTTHVNLSIASPMYQPNACKTGSFVCISQRK